MGRRRREWLDDGIYHLFSRGSNRQAIVMNNGDYADLNEILATACERLELDVFAWCLMSNHWHCVVRSPHGGLSSFMKSVNHRHSLRFNRRWERSAHLFENRFGAVLQESQPQFLWTLRYVVRNPVEAGLASSPFDARWTSFRATIGQTVAPSFLRVDEILASFGGDDDDARSRYVDFVAASPPAGALTPRPRETRKIASLAS